MKISRRNLTIDKWAVKEFLARKRWSQGNLASEIGTSEQYLSEIMKGFHPYSSFIPAIADALGVSIEDICLPSADDTRRTSAPQEAFHAFQPTG